MKDPWGRVESQAWPSDKPVWTRSVYWISALVVCAGLWLQYQTWTPLQRYWLLTYLSARISPPLFRAPVSTYRLMLVLHPLAGGTKEKIRDAMSAVFNHAIRWEFTDANPITGPHKGSGVRVSGKRERTPEILDVEEMQLLLASLGVRERAMVFLDMPAGLRRGELAGLKWEDVDFKHLHLNVSRSLVDQHVGPVKTEVSRKLMPVDEYVARDLLAWYEQTPYKQPSDYLWATDANRAGSKRRKQPVG